MARRVFKKRRVDIWREAGQRLTRDERVGALEQALNRLEEGDRATIEQLADTLIVGVKLRNSRVQFGPGAALELLAALGALDRRERGF